MLKTYFVALIAFAALDAVWLGFVMKGFNMRQLAAIGRFKENGDFDLGFAPAAVTYFLMAAAIVVFVLPAAENRGWLATFALGALMGLVVYGVYDLTNLAILKNYPLKFAIADMAWGAFVFGAVALIASALSSKPD